MIGNRRVWSLVTALCTGVVVICLVYRSFAQDEKPGAETKADSPEAAAVRKQADEVIKAFNRGDAKAMASFWTENGEYIGPDGETVRGRGAIEKEYAEFFKKNPKATLEIQIQSVRRLGPRAAMEEGTLVVRLPGKKEKGESRYSVLHVKEDDGWHAASVREWLPDETTAMALKDIDWLIGTWEARSPETEVQTIYEWDDNKAFLRCRYTVKQGDKVLNSGTQVIGKDPAGKLRSWLFDSSGSFGESIWSRDDSNRWVIEATATLPDGSEMVATNLLIPINKDTFTWQSVDRSAGGAPLPDVPPVKVTRVQR